jgi:hypothetical protein
MSITDGEIVLDVGKISAFLGGLHSPRLAAGQSRIAAEHLQRRGSLTIGTRQPGTYRHGFIK